MLVASTGADALALANDFHPTAVSLDVFLPDMLGWTVLSQLKQNPATRHIPVQIVTLEEDRQHGLSRGAFSFLTKPATPQNLQDSIARIRLIFAVEEEFGIKLSTHDLESLDDVGALQAAIARHLARAG